MSNELREGKWLTPSDILDAFLLKLMDASPVLRSTRREEHFNSTFNWPQFGAIFSSREIQSDGAAEVAICQISFTTFVRSMQRICLPALPFRLIQHDKSRVSEAPRLHDWQQKFIYRAAPSSSARFHSPQ